MNIFKIGKGNGRQMNTKSKIQAGLHIRRFTSVDSTMGFADVYHVIRPTMVASVLNIHRTGFILVITP